MTLVLIADLYPEYAYGRAYHQHAKYCWSGGKAIEIKRGGEESLSGEGQ